MKSAAQWVAENMPIWLGQSKGPEFTAFIIAIQTDARNSGLEEAAKVCDVYDSGNEADEIRALKQEVKGE